MKDEEQQEMQGLMANDEEAQEIIMTNEERQETSSMQEVQSKITEKEQIIADNGTGKEKKETLQTMAAADVDGEHHQMQEMLYLKEQFNLILKKQQESNEKQAESDALVQTLREKIDDMVDAEDLILKKLQESNEKQAGSDALIKRLQGKIDEMVDMDDDIDCEKLNEDTFSFMMTSKIASDGWIVGLCTFTSQMVLLLMILIGQIQESKSSSLFDAPFKVKTSVRIGQLLTVILSLLTQKDVLTGIQACIMFSPTRTDQDEYLLHAFLVDSEEDDSSPFKHSLYLSRILLPNVLKIIEGSLVLFTSLVIIIQSTDVVELLKDCTALYFVSEIDNAMFYAAKKGYFGQNLKKRVQSVNKVRLKVQDHDSKMISCSNMSTMQSVVLAVMFSGMLGTWLFVVHGQVTGKFFENKYPKCGILLKDRFKIGDGKCDGGLYNSIYCDFDGGDCINFNIAYPDCKDAPNAFKVGDGMCDQDYNTPACGYDGADCCPSEVANHEKFYDQQCNGGKFITKSCNHDRGKCDNFVFKIPDCPIEEIAKNLEDYGVEDYGASIVFGNGVCDSGLYMSRKCGYEGGDCKNCADIIGEENWQKIGDGFCNGGAYATEACGNDGGDCDDFNVSNPNCPIKSPDKNTTNYGSSIIIGDGKCNSGLYMSQECGFEGGDCQACASIIDEQNWQYIGDGFCNGGSHATEICANDGGDCDNCVATPDSDYWTRAIGVADFNNDDYVDIIVGIGSRGPYQTDVNNFLLNDGTGAFQKAIELLVSGGGTNTRSIGVGDFNKDGYDDIVIGNIGTNQLLLNDGTGAFPSIIELGGGARSNTRAIGVADFNNDGYDDIFFGNDFGEQNQLLINDRTGNFPDATALIEARTTTVSIGVADFNSDGHNDIVIGNDSETNQLLLNDGSGKFSIEIPLPEIDVLNVNTRAIGVADVNNDGHHDIIVGNNRNNQLYLNDGKGLFPNAIDLPGGEMDTRAIEIGDLNNDGYPDIVVGNWNKTGQDNQILINNRNGTFQDPISLPCSADTKTSAMILSDVNNDGLLDIIVGNVLQKNQVLINLGDGTSFKQSGNETNSDWWLPE